MTPTAKEIEANRRWLTLEALEAEARGARERVEALEAEQLQAPRALDGAAAPLRDYYEAVGAGERKPDAELESELRDQAREAQDTLTLRPIQSAGGVLGVDVVDERVEGELAGARRALEAAEFRVEHYLRRHLRGLAAELWPRTLAAREGFDAAWRELRSAEGEWIDTLRRWERLRPIAGVPVEEIPANPLRGVGREIDAGVPLPMPPSLIPDDVEPRE